MPSPERIDSFAESVYLITKIVPGAGSDGSDSIHGFDITNQVRVTDLLDPEDAIELSQQMKQHPLVKVQEQY